MRLTVKKTGTHFLVGHRRKKIFVYTIIVTATFFTIVYLYFLPEKFNPFEPFTLMLDSTPLAGPSKVQVVKDGVKRDLQRFQGYENSILFDDTWLIENCIGTLSQIEGIEKMFDVVDAWKNSLSIECRNLYTKFSDIYSVRTRHAPVVIPDSFIPKVLRWLGNSKQLLEGARSQLITSIENLYTQESTIFNPIRSKRPGAAGGATSETLEYVSELLQATEKDCDFCKYKNNTARDPFGSVDSQFTLTVSNTFKVEKFHSLVLWKHHNPLAIEEYELLDAMDTAQKWFQRAHAWDKHYTIPQVFWDTLPRASASQMHPHLHVTLAREHYYARWNHLYFAAKKYAEGHNGENYFSVLTKIHNALGLGVQFGSASVLAYLTPTASHEIVLLSEKPSRDLYLLFYACITGLQSDMLIAATDNNSNYGGNLAREKSSPPIKMLLAVDMRFA
ncbi:uncharacterized protein LOC141864518 isoform X2 [Acropora palmata]|uniref:uncharacterized protein LOC141864518 isoform X2 n=1 Tax=Acropora palmata TaxID=6131 RepID=UPI003DA197A4